jgi:hypothetical protein
MADPDEAGEDAVGADEPCIAAVIGDATVSGDALLRELVLNKRQTVFRAHHA